MWLQSQNIGYGVTRLCPFLLRLMCYVPVHLMALVPPLYPSDLPPSKLLALHFNLPACASLFFPLDSFPSVYFLLDVPPPVAPVVTWRPPVLLTGIWCHAVLVCLSSVLMLRFAPRPVRLVVIGSVVDGGA